MDWLTLVEKEACRARRRKIKTEVELRKFIREEQLFAELEFEEQLFDWLCLSLDIISVKMLCAYFEEMR